MTREHELRLKKDVEGYVETVQKEVARVTDRLSTLLRDKDFTI